MASLAGYSTLVAVFLRSGADASIKNKCVSPLPRVRRRSPVEALTPAGAARGGRKGQTAEEVAVDAATKEAFDKARAGK